MTKVDKVTIHWDVEGLPPGRDLRQVSEKNWPVGGIRLVWILLLKPVMEMGAVLPSQFWVLINFSIRDTIAR